MGISAAVLYNKLSPRTASNHVNFEEVSVILDLLTEVGKHHQIDMVINSFCWRHERLTVKMPEHPPSDDELFNQVLEIMPNHSALADGLRSALNDNDINARELAQLEQEFKHPF